MDILDPLEKILDVAMALKELVELFKGKDKWFESCYRNVSSVWETVNEYKTNRDPKKKIPDACNLLIEELDEMKSYLQKEQKRGTISAFFRGSTMVKEAQDLMKNIEKQIHNFNLAVSVEHGIETRESFKKLGSTTFAGPSLKTKFANVVAAEMWMSNFFQETQVSWIAFTNAFKEFVKASEKIELEDKQVDVIITTMDSDHDRLIRFEEWDSFFGKYWATAERANLLKANPVIQKACAIVVPPMTLKVAQSCEDDPKKFIYPIGHKFEISEAKVVFVNYEGKEVTYLKNWEKEALIIGKIKPNIFQPDIYFHNKLTSVKEKQFQIVLKKLLSCNGFYLNNLSAGNPTSLKIESIPYIVGKNMIFDLAETLIEVVSIEPEPRPNLEEENPDYFLVNFESKEEEEEEEDEDKPKKKKSQNALPSITLKIIQGEDEDKEAYTVTLTSKKDNKEIKIGSNEKNDIVIKEIEDIHMKIRFDPLLYQWVALSDEEDKKRTGQNSGAYLYLIGSNEWKDQSLKEGRISVKLRDRMKLAFGYNELEVIMNK